MSSLIVLLILSLAFTFCGGRSLHTSLSHSRKDLAKMKYPSSPIKESTTEKIYQSSATDEISRTYKNYNMEDEIKKPNPPSCFQRPKTVVISRSRPSYRISEENSGSMALSCCCRDHGLTQRKGIKVRSLKKVRSLVAENKLNEEQINPNKNMASASFVEMDYPSAKLAPSVNNR